MGRLLRALLPGLLLVSLMFNGYVGVRHLLGAPAASVTGHGASPDEITVLRTPGGLLQVSTIATPESFTATQVHQLFGVDLGATTSHLRVPVTYHYHLPLARDWPVRRLPDGRILVIAPRVAPTLPVAFDSTRMQAHAQGRWSLLTGADAIAALQARLTPLLAERAARPSYITLQREAARRTVAEFVRRWLLTQTEWAALREREVIVYFEDEPLSAAPVLWPALPASSAADA